MYYRQTWLNERGAIICAMMSASAEAAAEPRPAPTGQQTAGPADCGARAAARISLADSVDDFLSRAQSGLLLLLPPTLPTDCLGTSLVGMTIAA
jgi:hypothetical protein